MFACIDSSDIVGLRDRAVIAVMVYTAVRAGAIAKLRQGDFWNQSHNR